MVIIFLKKKRYLGNEVVLLLEIVFGCLLYYNFFLVSKIYLFV